MSFFLLDNDGDEDNNEGAATVAGEAILVAQTSSKAKGQQQQARSDAKW